MRGSIPLYDREGSSFGAACSTTRHARRVGKKLRNRTAVLFVKAELKFGWRSEKQTLKVHLARRIVADVTDVTVCLHESSALPFRSRKTSQDIAVLVVCCFGALFLLLV